VELRTFSRRFLDVIQGFSFTSYRLPTFRLAPYLMHFFDLSRSWIHTRNIDESLAF